MPSELYGFGNLLLWLLATRATQVVDLCYSDGPARPSPAYGTVDGHPVPTASLVAWLLVAGESGLPVDRLTQRDPKLAARQHVLRTIMGRVLKGRADLFENRWLDHLGTVCHLGAAELEVLATGREESGHDVDPAALRRAIARTLRSRAAAGRLAARTLPRDIASFTGREPELRQVVAAAATGAVEGVVGIHAIGGMAGVGKTAFAVHAAHRLAARFPDGQIFLPLHGHTPGQAPVTPEDALARLLQICGVTAGHIPQALEARAALWRDHLARRQLLLLLDDAAGHEQVRPLLPGSAGSMVIITSRRRLTALEDAHSVSLDTLTPDEAARLFIQLSGRPGLDGSDADVGQVTALCGYLPLTIGMQARRLHHHPTWAVADLAADLASAHDRLALMRAENLSVTAAFDLSYADLGDGARQLFRHLGLHPGDDIDAYAAAALDGTGLTAARRHLETLYDHYLLTEPVLGRYRPHDLIREHARALAGGDPAGDRDRALGRLLDYYQHTAAVAECLLARHSPTGPAPSEVTPPPAAAPALAKRPQALAWARAERANLLACLDLVTRGRQHARVVTLTAAIATLLRHDGPWTDALSRHAAALDAARHLGDRLAEANAQHETGVIRRLTGSYAEAIQAQRAALDIYRDLGNRLGEANAQQETGAVHRLSGEYAAAMAVQQAALGIYRALGNRFGEANAQHELGAVGYLLGDYPAAVAAQQAALDSYRALDDGLGQAAALVYLGAIGYLTGDAQGAAEMLETALDIYRDHGDQRGQANTLQQLGAGRRHSGDYAGAAEAFGEALLICRNLGYQGGEANALHYLGATRRLTGDHPGAAGALEAALGIYRAIGDRGGEAEALNEAGILYRLRGSLDQAEAAHRAALDLARSIASGWDEAHALAGLGRCAEAAGRIADARAFLQQAQDAFRDADADEATAVTAELDALAEPE